MEEEIDDQELNLSDEEELITAQRVINRKINSITKIN